MLLSLIKLGDKTLTLKFGANDFEIDLTKEIWAPLLAAYIGSKLPFSPEIEETNKIEHFFERLKRI